MVDLSFFQLKIEFHVVGDERMGVGVSVIKMSTTASRGLDLTNGFIIVLEGINNRVE